MEHAKIYQHTVGCPPKKYWAISLVDNEGYIIKEVANFRESKLDCIQIAKEAGYSYSDGWFKIKL